MRPNQRHSKTSRVQIFARFTASKVPGTFFNFSVLLQKSSCACAALFTASYAFWKLCCRTARIRSMPCRVADNWTNAMLAQISEGWRKGLGTSGRLWCVLHPFHPSSFLSLTRSDWVFPRLVGHMLPTHRDLGPMDLSDLSPASIFSTHHWIWGSVVMGTQPWWFPT